MSLTRYLNRYPKLEKSNNFKKIYDAIKLNENNIFSGNYCGEGDYSITVSNYIKKLKKQTNLANSSNTGGGASDGGIPPEDTSGGS